MTDGDVRCEDLEQETTSTLSGNEQFVMFDSVNGKRADIDDVAKYIAGDKSQLATNDKSSVVGAINELKSGEDDLKEDLSLTGIEDMAYVKTGTGYISDSGVVTYSSPGSGSNHMMLIDNADTISNIKHIKAYLGNNGFLYGIAFLNSGGAPIGYGEFPSQTATAQNIEVDVPANTAKIYIYNRYAILENPSITIATTNGYDARITEAEKDIESLNTITAEIPIIDSKVDEIDAIVSNDYTTIALNSMQFYSKGYIDNNGLPASTSSTSHKIMMMDASQLSSVKFKTNSGLSSALAFGVLRDADDHEIKTLYAPNTTAEVTWNFTPQEGNTLYVSWFNFATTPNPYYDSFNAKNYVSIVDAYGINEAGSKYVTCVKKPFAFNGKSIQFFGDSITYGYIAASGGVPAHQATNQYPKLFSQAVGASFTNLGVTGSTLSVITGYSSIYTAIQNATLNSDYVFVAGGVNDWQLGVDEATLKTAVENICDYLSNNFNGEVIWITPIYEAGRITINPPTQSLPNVRNVITRVALKYGYSVIQGWEFPFPKENDDSDYISLMFQDKLHPTELGYSMYANALRNALC